MDLDFQVKLYKPGGTHAAYRLYRYWKSEGKMEKIKSKELDKLNKQLKAGEISPAEANRLATALKENYQRDRDAQKGLPVLFFHEANVQLVEAYLAKVYQFKHHKKKSFAMRKNDLMRAVGLLERLSVQVATREALVEKLRSTCPDKPLYNRMADCLNSLLKYLGRDFRLTFQPLDYSDVTVWTNDEVSAMAAMMSKEQRLMCLASYAAGLRHGEVLGVEPRFIKTHPKTGRSFYWVEQQWNRDEKKFTPPKRGKKRDALILPQHLAAFKDWAAIPAADKRKVKIPVLKGGTMHTFRHSYATYLLRQGVSLSLVARFLGNALKVTEAYYAAYRFGDDDLQLPDGF